MGGHPLPHKKANILVFKISPPEVSGISFGDPKSVTLELSSRKDGFDFSQHVAENQRQLGQVPPAEKRTEKRTALL